MQKRLRYAGLVPYNQRTVGRPVHLLRLSLFTMPTAQRKLALLGLIAALALPAAYARADVFVLENGGQVEGRWLNRDASLQSPYEVQTAQGLTLQVDRHSVERVISQRDDLTAYEQLAPKVADNVEQQWKLAEWCRERYLTDERRIHLKRILELDPDHLPTRRALGYAQVEGQWLTRDQWRRKQGYEYYRGRWRLPQEIEILESRNKSRLAEKQWLARIRTLREMLATDEAAKARDELLAIDDPHAVPTLAEQLHSEPLRLVKLIYVTTLMRIGNHAAVEALVTASLNDHDEEIRVACLDAIEDLQVPAVVPIYVKALAHTNNFVVNRAAQALGRLGNETVAGSLINALVTTHTFTYSPRPNAGADTITTSFVTEQRAAAANAPPLVPNSNSGLAMGDGKKSITRRIPNEEVLSALLRITDGPNYGYNQQAWRQWQESRIQSANLNAAGQ